MTALDYRRPITPPSAPRSHAKSSRRDDSPGFLVSFLQTVCLLGPIACFAHTIREFPDDPGMTDRGLVDVVSLWYYVGLALCGLGFWLALQRDPLRQRLLAAQTAVLIVVIHALPALAYDAVRPFWAYKHIGVVDYITQNESVNRSIDVYHNWPGFFALGSILEDLTGISPLTYARWSPVLFNLLWAVGLLYVSRSLTDNARARWLGVFLFTVTNWFVLDYFAPQPLAFFWGLLIVATMLRWLSRSSDRGWVTLIADRLRPYTRTSRVGPDIPLLDNRPADGPVRIAAGLAVLLIFTALTFTHQLTPFIILIMCAAIVFARRTQGQTVLVMMVIITGAWIAFAWQYLSDAGFLKIEFDLRQSRGGFRQIDLSEQTFAMWFFSRTGIYANIGIFVMAVVGVARRVRAGFLDTVAILLAGAPAAILAGQSYGGEGVYRVMLFSLITVSLLAAFAFYPRYSSWQSSGTPLTTFVLCVGLAALVPVTIYGREQMNYVFPGEEDAALYIPEHAAEGWDFTTYCEGFPSRASANYGGFVDQQIDMPCMLDGVVHEEPTAATVDEIADFLEESFPDATQLLFAMSKGQQAFVDVYRLLPPGGYEELLAGLEASPRFNVFYENDDATIFELRGREDVEADETAGANDPASTSGPSDPTESVPSGEVAG